jgi:septal ring factor EnvC (AmiA/AmiB activator)
MAKKFVYQKSEHGFGDFVYVDLLPEVKRPRQFNVNVIISLLFAVVLVWVLIFTPITARTATLEDLKSWNNDLHYEYELAEEEFAGYGIDLEVLAFEENIDGLSNYRVDFNNLLDDVELEIAKVDGDITKVIYSAENQELRVTVQLNNYYYYNNLNHNLLNLPWVSSTDQTDPERLGDTNIWSATYILEVNPNVE